MSRFKIDTTVVARIIASVALAWASALPMIAAAATGDLKNCGAGGVNCLQNPLRFPTIETFIQGVLQAVVMIGLPVITVFVVYAGFKYIAARGNPSKISEAHKNFMWVMIGAALILGAWVLATLIGGTITQLLAAVSVAGIS